MEERKKWHEWLNSAGMVIALALAGVTFYYQFMRKPRELTAVLLPMDWDANETVTIRMAVWNDGSRDEVLESVSIVAEYRGSGKTAMRGHLLGPEVIKPGEARTFTASQTLEKPDNFKSFDLAVTRTPAEVNQKPAAGKDEEVRALVTLILEVRTVDRDGGAIVSRIEMGEFQIVGNHFKGGQLGPLSKRLNLLAETWVGERDLTVGEMR